MAKYRGIRRTLEIILDKAAARKMEAEAQAALKKGTDPKAADQNLGKITKGFDFVRGAALKLAGTLAAVFTFGAIKRFGEEAVRAFSEAEAVWSRLGGTLSNLGIEFRLVRGEIEAAARAMQDTTTMGDEDFAQTLQTLTQQTGDYVGSLKQVQLVADLAAGANLSFEQSATLVGKAMAGNTTQLTRMFPALKDSKDILGDLSEIMSGQARLARGTWAGALAALSNEWGDLKEAIGQALVEAGGGTSIIETLTGAIRGLTIWIGDNQQTVDNFAAALGTIATVLGDILSRLPRVIENLNRIDRFFGLKPLFEGDTTPRLPANVAITPNRPAGSNRPLPIPVVPEASDEEKAAAEKRIEDLWKHLNDWIHNVGPGKPVALPVTLALDEDAREKALAARARIEQFLALGGTLAPVTVPVAPAVDVGALEAEIALFETLGNVAGRVADDIADSFENAFDLMRKEGATVGNFLEGVLRGIGAAGLAGIAEYAQGKAAENVAAALEAGARALGFTSLGNFASAGAAAAAAAQHGLAALAWGALAGGAGVASGAVSGRGGGHGMSSHRDAGAGISEQATREPMTHVNIYIDPLTPNDPRVQRMVGSAAQQARETWGESAKITWHPYPSGAR